MKDVTEINVTQIRIYPSDYLPYVETSSGSNTAKVVEHFQFKTFQTEGLVHQFGNGVLLTKDGRIIVLAVTMDPRRITVQVRGGSAEAEMFHAALWKLLVTFRGTPLDDQPLIKSQETMCIAVLDIDFMEVVAQPLRQYLTENLKTQLSSDTAKARSVELKTLAFTIKYSPDSNLEEHGIALANKVLTLEPRAGTATRERRFFSSSPTDSETHLALLRGLEQHMLEARTEMA
jgi:hypothetical protein